VSRPSTNPIAAWAGLVVLYLVWGSTYLGMKVAMDTLPPFVMGMLRFIPAGILLTTVVVLRNRRTIARPTVVQVRDSAIVGAFLLLGGTGLVAWGEQTVPTGVAALLIGLMPMWLAIFGRILFGERIQPLIAVGILIGVAGVAILAWPMGGVGSLDPVGLAALIGSPMLWALGTLYAARRAVLPAPALFASGIEMMVGGVLFAVAATLTGELRGFDLGAISATSWLGIAYLVLVGSLVGYTTFSWLITVSPLSRVSTYAYVNPVVAVILGALILGEPLTPRTILAAVVITVAVVLIVTARGRTPSRTPASERAATIVIMETLAPAEPAAIPVAARTGTAD
jgi:drug/metabolite transporter (DMT)-like permease